jgi:hypothetical protein
MEASDIAAQQALVPDPESRFSGWPLRVDYIDGREWRLASDFLYRLADGRVCTVRKGFVFDWASIPRPLYWLYPPAGSSGNPYGVAALVHDWLYSHRKIAGQTITRRDADRVFLEIMRYVGCRWTLARVMYRAVRVGGWVPWVRRRAEDIIP